MLLINFTRWTSRYRIATLVEGDTIAIACFFQFLIDIGERFSDLKRSNSSWKNLSLQIYSTQTHKAKKGKYVHVAGETMTKQSI